MKVKYAVESKASRHQPVDSDSDGEGEELRGEGPHRRAQHRGVASAPSRHEASSEHTTGLDLPVVMATPHLSTIQSSELENVIEQVGVTIEPVGVIIE